MSWIPIVLAWIGLGYAIYRVGPRNVVVGTQNLLRAGKDAALLPFDYLWGLRYVFLIASACLQLLSLTVLAFGLSFHWRWAVAISGLIILAWLSFIRALGWVIAKYIEWLDRVVLGVGGKNAFRAILRFGGLFGVVTHPEEVTDSTFRLMEEGELVGRVRSIVFFLMTLTFVSYLYLWAIPTWSTFFSAPSLILLMVAIIYFGMLHRESGQASSGYLVAKQITTVVLYGYLGWAAFAFVSSQSQTIYEQLPTSAQGMVSLFDSMIDETGPESGRAEFPHRVNASMTLGIITEPAGLYRCVQTPFVCSPAELNGKQEVLPAHSEVKFAQLKPDFQISGEPVSEIKRPNALGEYMGQSDATYFIVSRKIDPIAPVQTVNVQDVILLVLFTVIAIFIVIAVTRSIPKPWGAVAGAMALLLFAVILGNKFTALAQAGLSAGFNRASAREIFTPPLYQRWTGTIAGDQSWQSTGVQVKRGDTVKITGNGRVCWAPDAPGDNKCVGPDGASYPPTRLADQSGFPLASARCGALVARIVDLQGGVSYYSVGNATTFTSQQEGEIQLMVNDRDYSLHDNSGSFHVIVSSS